MQVTRGNSPNQKRLKSATVSNRKRLRGQTRGSNRAGTVIDHADDYKIEPAGSIFDDGGNRSSLVGRGLNTDLGSK
jgi:hypothetical protein